MKSIFKIIIAIILIAAIVQLIGIDKTNQPVDPKIDFVQQNQTPADIQTLLRASCYDCHSNETIYPNYANYAPVSWMVADHVQEGRSYLNFSQWGSYNKDQQQGMLEKSIQTIKARSMPLPSYIQQHADANLTTQQREALITYFKTLQKQPN